MDQAISILTHPSVNANGKWKNSEKQILINTKETFKIEIQRRTSINIELDMKQ